MEIFEHFIDLLCVLFVHLARIFKLSFEEVGFLGQLHVLLSDSFVKLLDIDVLSLDESQRLLKFPALVCKNESFLSLLSEHLCYLFQLGRHNNKLGLGVFQTHL